jgi:hypothetical protein
MNCVLAPLLAEVEAGGITTPPWPPFRAPTLGIPNVTVARLLNVLNDPPQRREDPAHGEAGRVLDTQIEAHVHGAGRDSCTPLACVARRRHQAESSRRRALR